ncbi:hypothetical protein KJ840_04385 [Patescibacteria group bacterium]|nr:hypothetical protein [Patescibacteria group bacterium]
MKNIPFERISKEEEELTLEDLPIGTEVFLERPYADLGVGEVIKPGVPDGTVLVKFKNQEMPLNCKPSQLQKAESAEITQDDFQKTG